MSGYGKKKGPKNLVLRGRYWWWAVMIAGVRETGNTGYLEEELEKALDFARKKKAELREEYRLRREALPKHDLSLDEAADAWWLAMHPKFRKGGERPPVDNAFRQMTRAVVAFGAGTMVTQMNLVLFQRVRGELLSSAAHPSGRGRPRDGDGMKSSSVNHLLRCGMKVLAHVAATRKDIDLSDMPDPVRDDLYLTERGRTAYMSEIDEAMFCEAAEELAGDVQDGEMERRDYLDAAELTRFMNVTGMRTNEAFELRWDRIDWSALTQNMNFPVKARGLDVRTHPVFLEEEALAILDDRMAAADVHDVYVFTTRSRSTHWNHGKKVEKGQSIQWTHNRFGAIFKEIALHAGLPEDTIPHDCRRTCARRIWLSQGIEIAQAYLGHKERQTTLDYIGITEEDVIAARQALERDRARIAAEIDAALARGGEPPLYDDKRVRRIAAEIDRRRRVNARSRETREAAKKRQAAIRRLACRSDPKGASRPSSLLQLLPASGGCEISAGGRSSRPSRGSGRRRSA
ncbi:integrase [Bradyrhizobium diazoefficiens]|uniref:tyrosine-type recombinase/integrase n=1 Tax=Bradyrhizobium diazoefficiens TaxID=1355477 RepID=UPI00272AB015|nr:tyrosine-type recombinase/integrase [Bradyrhizobium diazoefficiens]WLA57487.1 tyrosine-type recombinase/integrase [Bradyrhizobium diazoefficiens]